MTAPLEKFDFALPSDSHRDSSSSDNDDSADDGSKTLSPPNSPPADGEPDLEKNRLERTKSQASIAATMSLPHEILFVAVICMAQFTTQAGLGQCLNIIHIIGDTFNISNPGELSWFIAGYSLTVGSFILVSGRFGDVFGYRRMLLIGFSWYSVWSVVAGLAVYSNKVLFIFARVLQGIGPAIVMPNGLAILGASYAPGRRKAMVFSLFGACAPGGCMVGAVFAGLFALEWWPWTFFSFGIALAGIVLAGYFVIPEPPRKHVPKTTSHKIKDLDLLGATLGITALVLFNFAWNQAPVVGWDKPYVYVLLIIGILLVPAFFYVELHVSAHPLIPFDALKSDVSFVLGSVACGWACFGIWVYYLWQFLQILRGASPLLTVAWLCPTAVSGALASITTGYLLHHFPPSVIMLAALTAFTVGTIIVATAPVQQIYWAQVFVCTVVIPWGMDMSFPAATLILSNAVSREHQGIAASLVSTVVNYSISLGLGFAGTIEVNVNEGGTTPELLLKGYRAGWWFGVGLGGLGMIITIVFFLKGFRKPQPKEADEGT